MRPLHRQQPGAEGRLVEAGNASGLNWTKASTVLRNNLGCVDGQWSHCCPLGSIFSRAAGAAAHSDPMAMLRRTQDSSVRRVDAIPRLFLSGVDACRSSRRNVRQGAERRLGGECSAAAEGTAHVHTMAPHDASQGMNTMLHTQRATAVGAEASAHDLDRCVDAGCWPSPTASHAVTQALQTPQYTATCRH
jgi:hypothetical protein